MPVPGPVCPDFVRREVPGGGPALPARTPVIAEGRKKVSASTVDDGKRRRPGPQGCPSLRSGPSQGVIAGTLDSGSGNGKKSRRGPGSLPGVSVVAADTAIVVAGLAFVLGVVVLVLLVWAPWNSVRNEPPLPDDIETRLLLGEDPEQIAADQDAAEARAIRAPVIDLSPGPPDDDEDGDDS